MGVMAVAVRGEGSGWRARREGCHLCRAWAASGVDLRWRHGQGLEGLEGLSLVFSKRQRSLSTCRSTQPCTLVSSSVLKGFSKVLVF